MMFEIQSEEICRGMGCYYGYHKSIIFVGIVDENKELIIIQESEGINKPIEEIANITKKIIIENSISLDYVFINQHIELQEKLRLRDEQLIDVEDENDLNVKAATDTLLGLISTGKLKKNSQIKEIDQDSEHEKVYAIKLLISGLYKKCINGMSAVEIDSDLYYPLG